MENIYDKAARKAIKLNPYGLLLRLLIGLDRDLRFARWLETQLVPFPGEPERRCDTVAELVSVSDTQPPWACVVEPQGYPDALFLIPRSSVSRPGGEPAGGRSYRCCLPARRHPKRHRRSA
jgi:hypothetical protein